MNLFNVISVPQILQINFDQLNQSAFPSTLCNQRCPFLMIPDQIFMLWQHNYSLKEELWLVSDQKIPCRKPVMNPTLLATPGNQISWLNDDEVNTDFTATVPLAAIS